MLQGRYSRIIYINKITNKQSKSLNRPLNIDTLDTEYISIYKHIYIVYKSRIMRIMPHPPPKKKKQQQKNKQTNNKPDFKSYNSEVNLKKCDLFSHCLDKNFTVVHPLFYFGNEGFGYKQLSCFFSDIIYPSKQHV